MRLQYFQNLWPEARIDAMREAAVEYGKLVTLKKSVCAQWEDGCMHKWTGSMTEFLGQLEKDMDDIQEAVFKIESNTVDMVRKYQAHGIPVTWLQVLGIPF